MLEYDVSKVRGYIKIPLPFIRLLLVTPKETANVIRWAVYDMAVNDCIVETDDILKSVLYAYYKTYIHNKEYEEPEESSLDPDISKRMTELWENNRLQLDFERDGFDAEGNFTFEGLEDLTKYADTDNAFLERCEMWYKTRLVCKDNGLRHEDVNMYLSANNRFSDFEIDRKPFAFVNTSIILRYKKLSESGSMPEFERVQFTLYAGIKSIIGLDDYKCASKQLMLSRMVGLKGCSNLKTELLSKKERTEANRIYKKYSQRRQFEKLLNNMLEYGYLKSCFGKKKLGYCLSTKISEKEVMERELAKEEKKLLAHTRVQRATQDFEQRRQEMKRKVLENGT